MREKIAKALREKYMDYGRGLTPWEETPYKDYWRSFADVMIAVSREEMKKVRSENPYSADEDTDSFFAFDLACVKIIKRMEGK